MSQEDKNQMFFRGFTKSAKADHGMDTAGGDFTPGFFLWCKAMEESAVNVKLNEGGEIPFLRYIIPYLAVWRVEGEGLQKDGRAEDFVHCSLMRRRKCADMHCECDEYRSIADEIQARWISWRGC